MLFPEHPKRDQNPKFTPLSEMTSIPIWQNYLNRTSLKENYLATWSGLCVDTCTKRWILTCMSWLNSIQFWFKLSQQLLILQRCQKTLLKLINNRWAWGMMPERMVEPRSKLNWVQQGHPWWQPCERQPPGTVTQKDWTIYHLILSIQLSTALGFFSGSSMLRTVCVVKRAMLNEYYNN